jgi:hypothetical protein
MTQNSKHQSQMKKVRAFDVDPAPLDEFPEIYKGAGGTTPPRL